MSMRENGSTHSSKAVLPEEKVIQRIIAGETELYSVLADRYGRRLHHFVRRIVRSEVDTEDVVQEAHLRVLSHLHQFEGRCKFATWLLQVAAHEAFRRLRQQRRLESLDIAAGYAPSFVSVGRGPECCLRDSEIRGFLRKALKKLPPRYRTIYMLREFRQMPTPEIAGRLKIRHGNVRLKLHRARRMLRVAMARCRQ